VLRRTHGTERHLDATLVVPTQISVQDLGELLDAHTLPRPAVEHLGLDSTEEALASRIICCTGLLGHGSSQTSRIHSFDPARPAVVAPAVRVNRRAITGT